MVKKTSFVYAAALLFFALPVFAQFPNDPLFVNAPDKQWNLFKIDMPNAWTIEKGDANILIAIMDTGIDGNWNGSTFSFTHPDLGGNSNRFIAGKNFEVSPPSGDIRDLDSDGHGSAVAGVAGADTDNNTMIAAVAPFCKMLIYRAVNRTPFKDAVIDAINVHPNTKVINFSSFFKEDGLEFQAAVDSAAAHDMLVVAAGGTSTVDGGLGWPGRLALTRTNVIAVNGTDSNDLFSHGHNLGGITVSAPGKDVLSTVPFAVNTNGYTQQSGSSFATPHVSGLAALIFSLEPTLKPAQVRSIIEGSADKVGGYNYNWDPSQPGYSKELGYGRINAYKALLLTYAYFNKSVSANATAWGSTRKSVYTINNSRWHQIFQTNGQLTYAYSTNDGSTWQGHQFVNGQVNVSTNSNPALATRNNFLYSVFCSTQEADFNYRIYLNRNSSGSWLTTPFALIATGNEITHLSFAIVTSNGTGHVVWVEGATALLPGNSTLKHGTFTVDAGTPVLSGITTVYSAPTATITNPALALDSNNKPHVIWSVSNEIQYSNKTSGSWSSVFNVSSNSGVSQYPSILASGIPSTIYAVWHDNTAGNNEIYYRVRSSGGSWGSTQNLSNSPASSTYPFIGGPINGSPVVLWVENVSGNNEIKYTWVGQFDTGLFATTAGSSLYPTFTFRSIPGGGRVLGLWTEGSTSPYLIEDNYRDFVPLGKPAAGEDTPETLPKKFALHRSYPNPFNPETTIEYDLPQPSHVQLAILNTLGQEVAQLVDRAQLAGRHRVTWQTNGHASGTYFYRLRAGEFEQMRQMSLVR